MPLDFLRDKETDPKKLEELKNKYKFTSGSETLQVAQYDVEGNLIQIHNSITQCARAIKCETKIIRRCVERNLVKAYGFHFISLFDLPVPVPNKIKCPTHAHWTKDEIIIK